ncbi:hypothetical protein PoB_001078900 [Plakobranchus ocellatus]|uniref:Uncharacterized protein n=1 Tax=Plakobranchus ocellatus TaxID=259542 RepID=A0AAV3YMQ1_9GAST|nr:hypothetical protein PoB_001078900 [Plakobranchus ocellatus]
MNGIMETICNLQEHREDNRPTKVREAMSHRARRPVQGTELRLHHKQARLLWLITKNRGQDNSGLGSFLRLSLNLSLVAKMVECVYTAVEMKGLRTMCT